jgi:crotonobetainyl-CoA:carnitine CoA-transferase CaiB-like acyl-CoA transferase
LKVVDLSSLWAGPLCSHLLQQAGFAVTKVESTHRPDGARFGHPHFFAELDEGKSHVEIDFRSLLGISELRALIETADVVIEGSRPRALQQLGIEVDEIMGNAQPQVWLSITGYGRIGLAGQRVGFGDDCAAAGGLVGRCCGRSNLGVGGGHRDFASHYGTKVLLDRGKPGRVGGLAK